MKEPRWPAALALLACVALYVALPTRLTVGPRWILPVLVALPLAPLMLHRTKRGHESPWSRRAVMSLVGVTQVANVTSLALLVHHLLKGHVTAGRSLVYSAIGVWVTNVILYGIWFWEVDRGGPEARQLGQPASFDLQFPQMENPTLAPPQWRPHFVDYLYTAFVNATSFAPADAMPLSARMKVLFAGESIVSLVTIAIVAARAVNILH